MAEIEYEKLETRRIESVPTGSKVKLPDDPAGRMFIVGCEDRHGMISMWRGKLGNERIEVSAAKCQPVVIYAEAK